MYIMATYNPPIHQLPIFEEWVFNQANEPEYLDQLVVHKAGTEQISGNKNFTGTTTLTGNLVASGLTITPTEISFLDGATSNLQAQIDLRALDSTVVHRIGNLPETVSGVKTFTNQIVGTANLDVSGAGNNILTTTSGTNILRVGAIDRITTTANDTKIFGLTSVGYRTNLKNVEINTSVASDIAFIDFHSGGAGTQPDGANDFDARIRSTGGTTNIDGRGAMLIEDGTFTVNSATSNELQVNSLPKITTTSSLNTISNTANNITASTGDNIINTTSGLNQIRVGGTPKLTTGSTDNNLENKANYIASSGTDGLNSINTTGANSFNIMSASGAGSRNTIVANDDNGFNRIYALGTNGYNDIYAVKNNTLETLSGSNILKVGVNNKITTTTDTNTISNVNNRITGTRTYTDANIIEATGAGGNNRIEASSDNRITTTSGYNLITTTSGTNQTSNVSGNNTISTTSGNNDISTSTGFNRLRNDNGINYIDAGGVNGYNEISSSNRNSIISGGTTAALGNLIDAVVAGGGNTMRTTTGTNLINTASGSNILQVGANPKITTTSSLTTLSNNAHSINGVATFDVPPVSATAPTTNSQIANKKYVDDAIVAGDFVTRTTTQTITGAKTFTGSTIFAQRTNNNKIELAEANIGLGYTFIDLCSGGNGDYDTRLASSGGTGTVGRGGFVIEAGTIRNYAITSNTLEVNNVIKLTTTSNTNTLANDTNLFTNIGGTLEYARMDGANSKFKNATQTIASTNSTIINYVDGLGVESNRFVATGGSITLTADEMICNSRLYSGGGSLYPLCNFTLSGSSFAFNGTSFQMSIGNSPDNSITNAPLTFILPFICRVVAWSLSGDTDPHSAIALRMRISTAGSGGGTIYYDQQGNLAADRIRDKSVCMGLNGNIAGWTSVGFNNPTQTIPAGTQLFCFINTSANMANEFSITLFFQQWI
jgi:hypothetical protein